MLQTPKKNGRITKGLILDPVHPQDFNQLNFIYACEQCSHFDQETQSCTIGYDANLHMQKKQLELYELCGRMAFCRFSEID